MLPVTSSDPVNFQSQFVKAEKALTRLTDEYDLYNQDSLPPNENPFLQKNIQTLNDLIRSVQTKEQLKQATSLIKTHFHALHQLFSVAANSCIKNLISQFAKHQKIDAGFKFIMSMNEFSDRFKTDCIGSLIAEGLQNDLEACIRVFIAACQVFDINDYFFLRSPFEKLIQSLVSHSLFQEAKDLIVNFKLKNNPDHFVKVLINQCFENNFFKEASHFFPLLSRRKDCLDKEIRLIVLCEGNLFGALESTFEVALSESQQNALFPTLFCDFIDFHMRWGTDPDIIEKTILECCRAFELDFDMDKVFEKLQSYKEHFLKTEEQSVFI